MEYTIKKLAQLSGVSTRTLRYYDEIELLKPARVNSSGYRIYGTNEIDQLQQILFYRSMDMKLSDIKNILQQANFDFKSALETHQQKLLQQRLHIDELLLTVEKTLAYHKGEEKMSDKEKFTAFKQSKLTENETLYGDEIRQKYGDSTIEEANKKWLNMSEAEFNQMAQIENDLFVALGEVLESQDYFSEAAETVYAKHKEWLAYSWKTYSKEAHLGLAEMYLADERFQAYYDDKVGENATKVLCEVIKKYSK